MTKVRIGTRASKLALYQANLVKQTLSASGIDSEIVEIHSEGDLDTTSPLHKMGSVGVFTKALDDALLNNEIDIAVHSCKDLPTNPDEGLKIHAYLERGPFYDVLIHTGDSSFLKNNAPAIIGTGSLRRRAQWKKRFENHSFEELRGNIATRVDKLEKSDWQGIILAEAALKRLNYSMKNTVLLTWMIPAPAQGVIAVVGRSDDSNAGVICQKLNHPPTQQTSEIERKFLNILEGGCSAPIGALITPQANGYIFKGILSDVAGTEHITIEETVDISLGEQLGVRLAEKVLSRGGDRLIKEIKSELK